LLLLHFVGFAIGAGLLAGTYPAFYLSRFDPVGVLASSGSNSRSRSSRFGLRKGLMVLQFVMALFFIITAVLFYRQASFMAHTDYGFKTERLSYVKLQDTPPEAFKNRTMQLLGVESVSMTSKVPVVPGLGRDGGTTNLRVVGGQPNDVRKNPEDGVKAYFYWVGADYVENMGLELIAGQERVKTAFTDGSSVIINERAVQELGFGSPSQAIGQTITYGEGDMRVVGVVEDYTYMSLRRQRYPLILRHDPEQFRYALVRAHPGHVKGVVSGLRDVWAQFDSVHPLDYGLYDDALERMAAPLVEGARLIGLAALLTVLIACLGLLGMAAYAVRTRTQEIGIRKALGASAEDVVWLLSKGYLWLVAGAAALALPLAYLVNRQWLADYAHRIDIGWVTPALCTATLLALALAVVGTQTVRAALANPADSLRHE
jgi:putative ABC transport system permease protein